MIYAIRYALIALYTVFWSILACLVAPFDRSGDGVTWIARRWIRWIFAACGIEIQVAGLEHLEPAATYVVMSNHQSAIDIGALVTGLPFPWRFVAKKEIARIPFFGWAVRLAGNIVIDRSNNERSVASLQAAARRIREGLNVIIFPEGTRSPTGELQDFKSGGFHLAIEAGVPILPVTVSGSQRITPKHSLRVESGVVKLQIGAPIPTAGLGREGRHELKERVRSAILAGYDPAFQESATATDRTPHVA